MLADRKAKIVATMGPSTRDPKILENIIKAGLNVARLNFSHGSHEDHSQMIGLIRELSQKLRAPVGLLQDLQGPKIRIGRFPEGQVSLRTGQRCELSPHFKEGSESQLPIDLPEILDVAQVGQKILMDDGLLEVVVTEVLEDRVITEVVHGGILKDRKGVNLPGADLPIPSMTEKDHKDLEFGISQNVDFVALSFVRRASDIRKLRQKIEDLGGRAKIIAKIEMLEAIENLEDIVRTSDGVMVARGDLAIEVGQTQLARHQKNIINLCNQWGKPVITATQMLDSMTQNPRPTRAEITDIANAILDGSDALMLSGETAAGRYPVASVRTMHEIILEVEKTSPNYYKLDLEDELFSVPGGIGASASLCALKLGAKAIVCLSTTGRTASIISRFRPKAKLISVTHEQEILGGLELIWGIQTLHIESYDSFDQAMKAIESQLVDYGVVKTGDRLILTLGLPVEDKSKTNALRVYTVGESGSKVVSKDRPLRYL